MKTIFFTLSFFICLTFFANAQHVSPIEGSWLGTLPVPGITLRLVFHIHTDGNGYKATLDSPDQKAKGIPIDIVTFQKDSLQLVMNRLGAAYKGIYSRDSVWIQGVFSQGGQEFPLVMRRTTEEIVVKRPQEPQRPFPYKEEEVIYENPSSHSKLAGTFTYPSSGSNFPVVILITGSGPQDRDESLMGHKPFLVLSDYLTRKGIAVLRVDDRGVGKSTGDFGAATSVDFAEDVKAGIAYLKARKEVNPRKIGLIGHSEGAMIAPMVAVKNPDVAFLVLMAGPGISGKEILRTQTVEIYSKMGATDSEIKQIMALSNASEKLIVQNETDIQKLRSEFTRLIQMYLTDMNDSRKAQLGLTADAFVAQLPTMRSPWMKYFVSFDPEPVLRQIKIPVLAINGSKDVQVLPDVNLKGIETALKQGGNKRLEIHKLDGLNHLFQKAESGLPVEYNAIEETINPLALTVIGNWVSKVSSR